MADCEIVGPCEELRKYLHVPGCACPARAKREKCDPGGVEVPRNKCCTVHSLHVLAQRRNMQNDLKPDNVNSKKGLSKRRWDCSKPSAT